MSDFSGNETATLEPVAQSTETVFKKWHRTGFISVGYWAKADKVIIELGSMEEGGTLKSATKCFIEAPRFLSYLRAEVNGTLSHLYPDYETKGFEVFGGTTNKDGVISRVFKSTYWTKGDKPDLTGRAFKCGQFKGTKSAQGAIMPIYKEKLSLDSMRISVEMLAEMYEILYQHRLVATLLYHMDIPLKAKQS